MKLTIKNKKEVALTGDELDAPPSVMDVKDGFFSADDFTEMAQFAEESYLDCLDNNKEIGWKCLETGETVDIIYETEI